MNQTLEELAGDLMDMDLRDYNFDDLTIFNNQQPVTTVMTQSEIRAFLAERRAQAKKQTGGRTWHG
jgi:hypothetical protein